MINKSNNKRVKQPLVSIVIPVHNGEKYIKGAIDSCLNQSYANIEVIVVNDASTDSTNEILDSYNNDIRHIKAPKQSGLGNVINIGIREARGGYIARMDADDIMYPDRIAKQTDFLNKNPQCILVGGQVDIMDRDGKIVNHWKYPQTDKQLRKNLFIFQPFAHPAITIRRSALEEIGLYPEDIWKVEDVKLMFLLSRVGEFANLPDTVIKYRMTYDTESQGDVVGHFKETQKIRKWAIQELNIKPTLRERFLQFLQTVSMYILGIFPNSTLRKLYELAIRIFK